MKLLPTTITNLCRLLVSITFILSGFVKAVDPVGTQYKIQDYAAAVGFDNMVPDWVTLASSVVLSGTEFVLGILLLFAIRRRLVTRLTLLFIIAMTAITVWLYIANPVSDCGCFGDAIRLTNGETLLKNIILCHLRTVGVATYALTRMVGRAISGWYHYSSLRI